MERFPIITGSETQAEENRLARQMQEWRRGWLRRLYGALIVLAVPASLLAGLSGVLAGAFVFAGVIVFHILIDARILAVAGRNRMALFYRVMAGYLTLGMTALLIGLLLGFF